MAVGVESSQAANSLAVVVQADVPDMDATLVRGTMNDPMPSGDLGGEPAWKLVRKSMGLYGTTRGQSLDRLLNPLLVRAIEARQVLDGLRVESYRPSWRWTSSHATGLLWSL